jgi:hypothetical protein
MSDSQSYTACDKGRSKEQRTAECPVAICIKEMSESATFNTKYNRPPRRTSKKCFTLQNKSMELNTKIYDKVHRFTVGNIIRVYISRMVHRHGPSCTRVADSDKLSRRL